MKILSRWTLLLAAFSWGLVHLTLALADTPKAGIVIMHGKGGSPARHVSDLAGTLEREGFLVANLEMPWSGKRNYDVPVSDAEHEVVAALTQLRSQGAARLFVAGHSLGGAFALHFAGRHAVDGIVCIVPGGNVASQVYLDKLGPSVERARQLIADGKGDEKTRLEDYESSKGLYALMSAPAVYLTWFDPDGAMNMTRAAQAVDPATPVLWLVAERDYPGLRRTMIPLFGKLPSNPHTRLVEPASDHLGAPSASADEIMRWVSDVMRATR